MCIISFRRSYFGPTMSSDAPRLDLIGRVSGSLQPGALYILLDLRSADLNDTTFHWALYLHKSNGLHPKGYKYHIKTLGEGWIADHGPLSGVTKSFLLVCLVRIAHDIPASQYEGLARLITLADDHINDGAITCRVWTLSALERLRGARFIQDDADVEGLEREVKRIGNNYRAGAVQNEQPRPIVDLY
ncbi:uncharacterized protein B0H18DRAFT_1028165 [Fomitopsis serialis]|uniref:uncharacterized protein n=1 Tax=Fomitopsis serialis TaxID=139415 RepID=UPI00200855B6|nr:uncharacterized protein B0H18DRAFT_1028165 [Neoantrodia serialis]KAH9919290.1 hypothetical protein B0H18DRAFT_1028165 [Neoantrodia serialis]